MRRYMSGVIRIKTGLGIILSWGLGEADIGGQDEGNISYSGLAMSWGAARRTWSEPSSGLELRVSGIEGKPSSCHLVDPDPGTGDIRASVELNAPFHSSHPSLYRRLNEVPLTQSWPKLMIPIQTYEAICKNIKITISCLQRPKNWLS